MISSYLSRCAETEPVSSWINSTLQLQSTRNVDWSMFHKAAQDSRRNRGWIQQPSALPLPLPHHGRWRDGDDIEQILVQAIELAQHEIVLAVQELSAPTIADAHIAARRRRVTVQVILENTYSTPWTEQTPTNSSPINASAGISWNS